MLKKAKYPVDQSEITKSQMNAECGGLYLETITDYSQDGKKHFLS